MALLQPDLMLPRITQLSWNQLRDWGIAALILDVDNTLTGHDEPDPAPDILLWLRAMEERGIKLMILSNNNPERVRPFAQQLGLPFTADAAKPLTGGYRRAVESLGVEKHQVAAVGDQIYTDVLGGNLYGVRTVLVEPLDPESERSALFRLKRRLELPVIRRYRRKHGRPDPERAAE